jgi:hypothetical protein
VRRYRFWLACAATAAALLAAVWPRLVDARVEYSSTVALACLSAIVVIWYTYFTYQTLRAVVRANKLALERERRRWRPYIVFDLEPRLGLVWVVLRNMGVSAAREVRVHVEPTLLTEINGSEVQSALTRGPIAFLAPGRALEDLLDEGGVVLRRYPDPIFRGRVTYLDLNDKSYDESFTVDLRLVMDTTDCVQDNQSRSEGERIARAIRELGRRLK